MSLLRPLSDLTRDDLALAGGKGANLGELTRAGFAVPDGFVVTTAAYDAYVDALGIRHDLLAAAAHLDAGLRIRAMFSAPPPEPLAAEIAAAYAALGPHVAVAVRSSATAEDLPEASFAGQQDSFLGVRGLESLLDAVRRCWASLWTDRALAYRARAGIDPAAVSLAVVVQRLADADAAGVMFTANPATGRRTETLINAAFGFGEAVVGGEVTPDELVVSGGRVVSRTTADKAVHTVRTAEGTCTEPLDAARRRAAVLTDDQAVELAGLGRRIEAHFGAPQDVEWVLGPDGFAVLQSRPITALAEPVGPVPSDWRVPRSDGMYIRGSIIEQLPDPLSPLFADLLRPAVIDSLLAVLRRFLSDGVVRDGDIDLVTVNGYAYGFYTTTAMSRLFLTAPLAIPYLWRSSASYGVRYWREVGLPTYEREVAEWSARDPGAMTPAELLAGGAALVRAGAVYYTSVQTVIPLTATAEIAFTTLYDALAKRPGDPPATRFLIGFESAPIRAERSLDALAAWCRATPDVAAALAARHDPPEPHRAAFEARLAAHLAEHGHLTYNLDVLQPVAADDPAPVLAALRFALTGAAPDPDARLARLAAERTRAEAELFARLDPVRGALLRRVLSSAQRLGPLREDALAAVGLGWPAARRFLRELGARLAAEGVLAAADDVFWLTEAEVRGAASDPSSRADQVAARKETWRGQRLAHPPGWLPRAGFFYEVFKDLMPGNESVQAGPTLKGLASSGGRVTGPARVLVGPEDFGSMQPGEILVAAVTTPAYTPFFAMASGVVTDIGGPLSHSSIVAREYGIPAVLGTGSATAHIRTGDRITVDGDAGLVLLDPDAAVVSPARRRVPAWAATTAVAAGLAGVAGVALVRRALRSRRRRA